MDFRTLQYFQVVAKELNFTHAAEKLNMSQPPLSSQIKNLEDDLGVQLFIRGKRKMQLTEAGRLLFRRSEQLLSLADKTRTELSSLGEELSGNICLGMVEGRAPFLAARWLAGFREEFPRVTFQLRNGSGDDITDLLSRGLVDAAILARPFDRERFNGIPVGREPWVAFIPVNHPLAKLPGDSIPLKMLADEPLIIPNRQSRVEAILHWFSGIDESPNIFVQTPSYINAVALVEQGAGISIYPQTTYTPNQLLVTKLITDPAKIAEYELITERNQHLTSLVQEFLNYVKDFMEEKRMEEERFRVHEKEYDIPADAEIL